MPHPLRPLTRALLLASVALLAAAGSASAQRRCNTDQDCRKFPSGAPNPADFDRCIGGGCVDSACDRDADCPARQRCEQDRNRVTRCVAVECKVDSECPPPGSTSPFRLRYCINYQCEACKFDNECPTRSCNEQTNDCITCRANSDCPPSFPTCFHGTCGNCANDADCRKPGFCGEDNACVVGACRGSGDCLPGWDCRNGRCAVQQTDLQRLLAELRKLRELVVEFPPQPGGPLGFDLGGVGALINGSGAVRSRLGLRLLDRGGRPLVDLGQFEPNGSGGLNLPGSVSGRPLSAIDRGGDLCGFSLAVTDERGNVAGQTSVCLRAR